MLNLRKRLPEIREVARIYQEQRGHSPFWHIIRAAWTGPVPRSVWRQRLLTKCKGCPLHDREQRVHRNGRKWRLNACAGPLGTGCGCPVFTVAMTANPSGLGCWGKTWDGDFGWGPFVYRSFWHRLTVTFWFLLGR